FRAPRDGTGNPSLAVGFMPAPAVHADLALRRERALDDLAVDGGPAQPGPGKHGSQPDDTVWFAHNRAGPCWLSLTASETRQDKQLQRARGLFDSSQRGVEAAANGWVKFRCPGLCQCRCRE